MTQYKFHYYGDRSEAYTNVITAVTIIEGDKVKCGFSFCNKKDKYIKCIGRYLAIDQLHKSPIVLDISERITVEGIGRYQYMHMLLAAYLATSHDNAPSWVYDTVLYDYYNYRYHFAIDESEFELPDCEPYDYVDEMESTIDFGDARLEPNKTIMQKLKQAVSNLFIKG